MVDRLKERMVGPKNTVRFLWFGEEFPKMARDYFARDLLIGFLGVEAGRSSLPAGQSTGERVRRDFLQARDHKKNIGDLEQEHNSEHKFSWS